MWKYFICKFCMAVLTICTTSQVLLFWFWFCFKAVLLRAQSCWFNFTNEEHKKSANPPSHIKFAKRWPHSWHGPGQYGSTQKHVFTHFKHQILKHQKSIYQENTAVGGLFIPFLSLGLMSFTWGPLQSSSREGPTVIAKHCHLRPHLQLSFTGLTATE